MRADPKPIVDLIIPAYNEQQNIVALGCAIPRDYFRHIILVDNNSTDNTADLARQQGFVVLHQPTRGYGAACLKGICWLKLQCPPPEMVAFLDADLSDDPSLLPKLGKPIARGEAMMVIGSRRKLAEPGSLTFTQRFGNRLACFLIWLTTCKKFTDLGPMRVIDWPTLLKLDMRDTTWGWTVEMQYKAAARKLACFDIDVPYRRRNAGVSKISGSIKGSIKAGYKILMTIFCLWCGDRCGKWFGCAKQKDIAIDD
ncbi:MAG TPA: UDP-glucose--dolichyl-phosphate glucosyltransferase [Phycisphaerales bacterium]|nr:UDP-glucose--dolichyl-phosphate glucosyltransferase [Phycisphaerales bacterium]HCD31811.1 UDP-glucose--dolichyl-phosphate glucosyltransferase [Phycisphaerales bacterium]